MSESADLAKASAERTLLGIDPLMDMARTAINVLGNSLATVVVARKAISKAIRWSQLRQARRAVDRVVGDGSLAARRS
jgi:Na+/H+-dicarboxylate symporter